MKCARTVFFASAAMIAVAISQQVSYSAEKGGRLKPPEGLRSVHMLTVPLDATVTAPIFSISWWSRVTPAPGIDPPSRLLRESAPNDVTYQQGTR